MEDSKKFIAAIFKKLNEFKRKYNTFKAENGDKVYLVKYEEGSSALLKMLSAASDDKAMNFDSVLQLYCQAVLDLTYYEENKLVDNDFNGNDVTENIGQILGELSYVETLHSEFSVKTLLESIGAEMLECLHWRRGALLYMYCHTMYNDATNNHAKLILLNCQKGVVFLQQMLSVRSKDVAQNRIICPTDDTLSLINHGIFGDTHMLAAMYAGEMSYWFWKISQSNSNLIQSAADDTLIKFHQDINKTTGELLGLYISSADGPLKSMGWSTTRAKEILKEMAIKCPPKT